MSENAYGFEGICLAENLDRLAGMDIATEIASLFQISVAVMKTNSKMRMK
jgi:ABC-2 type transport system ATP-binding protein